MTTGIDVFTAEERPDLWERAATAFADLWPEYNNHGDVADRYFSALFPGLARFQVILYDAGADEVVGRGRTIPFRWDGTDADLPEGIDGVGLRALEPGSRPTALSALAAEVARSRQGGGLSRLVLESMLGVARRAGLSPLVAPVRPSWKERYPITPIEEYAYWRRADGAVFDPWLRVHERMGATVLRPEPHSLRITAPVSDWEAWTAMAFPAPGSYVFPQGLAPLSVGDDGVGRYWEPNVWMLHPV